MLCHSAQPKNITNSFFSFLSSLDIVHSAHSSLLFFLLPSSSSLLLSIIFFNHNIAGYATAIVCVLCCCLLVCVYKHRNIRTKTYLIVHDDITLSAMHHHRPSSDASSVGCCCWRYNQTEPASKSTHSFDIDENTDRYLIVSLLSFLS